jgi:hypothetical protein
MVGAWLVLFFDQIMEEEHTSIRLYMHYYTIHST